MVIGRLEVPVGNDEDVVGKSATTVQGVFSSGTSAGERPVRRESQERRGAPLTERVRKPFGWVGPAASRCGRLVKVGRVGW
jgi:hypothetical protein